MGGFLRVVFLLSAAIVLPPKAARKPGLPAGAVLAIS
jgi:hypothetical protein